jgi:transcriptional regulator with XRE-family HTH domain
MQPQNPSGRQLRNLRIVRGLTPAETAGRAGIPVESLELIEAGSREPTVTEMLGLTGAIDSLTDELNAQQNEGGVG